MAKTDRGWTESNIVKLLTMTSGLAVAGLLFLGLGFCVTAISEYRIAEPEPSITIDAPEFPVKVSELNRVSSVDFHVHNRAKQALQVIGLAQCCGVNSRFWLKQSVPFEVPSGDSDLSCNLEVFSRAAFENELRLFVNDNGLREVRLTISSE